MKIYLCGTLTGLLRKEVTAACGEHQIIDPASHGLTQEKDYTTWDLAAIRESDVVVAFMDSSNPSGYGLSLEVGYAHALGKPIIYLDLLGNDWRQKYFGMVRSVSQTISSVQDIQSHLRAIKSENEVGI